MDVARSPGSGKAFLMAILASRGLISKDDVVGYQSVVTAYAGSGRTVTTTAAVTGIKSSASAPSLSLSPLAFIDDSFNVGLIPAVVDGPYLCTSLNHKAPVIQLIWRDEGPVSDCVFVPSVACSLTMDNCITVWLETAAEVIKAMFIVYKIYTRKMIDLFKRGIDNLNIL